jgi:hypothetical protein
MQHQHRQPRGASRSVHHERPRQVVQRSPGAGSVASTRDGGRNGPREPITRDNEASRNQRQPILWRSQPAPMDGDRNSPRRRRNPHGACVSRGSPVVTNQGVARLFSACRNSFTKKAAPPEQAIWRRNLMDRQMSFAITGGDEPTSYPARDDRGATARPRAIWQSGPQRRKFDGRCLRSLCGTRSRRRNGNRRNRGRATCSRGLLCPTLAAGLIRPIPADHQTRIKPALISSWMNTESGGGPGGRRRTAVRPEGGCTRRAVVRGWIGPTSARPCRRTVIRSRSLASKGPRLARGGVTRKVGPGITRAGQP